VHTQQGVGQWCALGFGFWSPIRPDIRIFLDRIGYGVAIPPKFCTLKILF